VVDEVEVDDEVVEDEIDDELHYNLLIRILKIRFSTLRYLLKHV
jgi:hypothetical protein